MSELYLILNCGHFFIHPSQWTVGENSVFSANYCVHINLKALLCIVVLFKIPLTELVYSNWICLQETIICLTAGDAGSFQYFCYRYDKRSM